LNIEGWVEYWRRIIDARRIPARWYVIIVFSAPCLFAAAVLFDVVWSGPTALSLIREKLAPFLTAPSTIFPFLLRVLVYGPFPEELGWRGYALDRLQERYSALLSSLILGAIWAVWHVPLFFIRDTLFHEQGAWSAWFWLFVMQVVALAVVLTWVFNNSRRSTLATILFHYVANVTLEIANVTATINLFSTLLWVVAAAGLILFWGGRTLTRCL
jgi:membrane protease YdiL (CAAX protease family)